MGRTLAERQLSSDGHKVDAVIGRPVPVPVPVVVLVDVFVDKVVLVDVSVDTVVLVDLVVVVARTSGEAAANVAPKSATRVRNCILTE